MLGWRILDKGDYRLRMPSLGKEEEMIIIEVEDAFREESRLRKPSGKEESIDLVRRLIQKKANEMGVYIDHGQIEYLSKSTYHHVYGFAFLDILINDPEIEEISIIGVDKPAYVFLRGMGWQSVNACFESEKAIADTVNKMSRQLGRHITIQNPRLDAMLPDGSRLHASLPPISDGEITIRKFRQRPFSPKELADSSTIDHSALAFLSMIMQGDHSLVIAGNTASGKTTSLNAMFSFVPINERVIITEETPEINVPHPHQLRLVANKDMGIKLKDLVYDSLRMRPDRMIVGEIRNKEEAEALFDVLLAGQARGSYATMHAQSAGEAMSRLRGFGVAQMDLRSIDCLLVQRRMLEYNPKTRRSSEIRRVVEIAEIGENINRLYLHKGKLSLKKSSMFEKISESFKMTKKEALSELKRREKIIKSADEDFTTFVSKMQKELHGIEDETS